jgi:hypothetical protein
MKTILPAIAWTCMLLLASCSHRSERAAEYNDSIVNQQMNIIRAFDLVDSTLNDTLVQADRLDYAFMNLQTTVKRGLLALDSIGSFQKDPSLGLAAKELFRSYESLAGIEYNLLMGIKRMPADQVTQTIADSSLAIQQRILNTSKIAQERFLKEQETFGAKYNLEFE